MYQSLPSSSADQGSAEQFPSLASRSPIVSIRSPNDGELRVRKVISRSKARSTGKFPSWKVKRMIHWESPHELNAFRLLDAHAAVVDFAEQPLEVTYLMDGEEHVHFPDILVNVPGRRELWEVKTAADAKRFEARTLLLRDSLRVFGYTYRVILAEDLALQPRLENAQTVLWHGRGPIRLLPRERARRILQEQQSITWAEVLNDALGPRSREIACRFLLEGSLRFDSMKRLDGNTVLHWVDPCDPDRYDPLMFARSDSLFIDGKKGGQQ